MSAAEIANRIDQLATMGWTIQFRGTEDNWVGQAVAPASSTSVSGVGPNFKAMGADLLSKIDQ